MLVWTEVVMAKRARQSVAVVSLVCVLIGVPFLAAQDAAQVSALDRTIAGFFGTPFLFEPPAPDDTYVAVLAIGGTAGIPIGFEAVRGDRFPDAARILAAAKTRTPVSLAGKTVREALDHVVASDPRYQWVDMNGVLVVRPIVAWLDPDNPLNRSLGDIDLDRAGFATVLDTIFTRLSAHQYGTFPPREPYFAIRLRSASALDVLNEIARSHGAVEWDALYDCAAMGGIPDTLQIRLKIHGGYGLGRCTRYERAEK
jgi:hypothetical protein